jgi:hypothetical protein
MIKPIDPIFEFDDWHISKSGANAMDAEALYHAGLLSFDPRGKQEFPRADIEELTFLKKIYFESGLDVKVVHTMLNKLEKPYRYTFDHIYWDFGSKDWKETKIS